VESILDEVRGRFFLWDAHRSAFGVVDVEERVTSSRSVGGSTGTLAFEPEAAWPSRPPASAIWAPRGAGPFDPDQFQRTPGIQLRSLVASRDGNVIYAAGFVPGSDELGRGRSNGIWAFNAETLAVLGHWDPVAEYDALAMTPDGRWVIALGDAASPEVEAFGNHGRTIAFHDARTGQLGLVLRHDVSGLGFMVPEPSP
jgi:hypothetical protein